MDSLENEASKFFELASDQRLNILFSLLTKKSKVSTMAKELDSTIQQVDKNFHRLTTAKMIAKDVDGYYHLTTFGETICTQIPSLVFISRNMKYFSEHYFGDIPKKFIMRIGALASGQYVKGFIKVLDNWKIIFKNANEYIYGIISEEALDHIEPIVDQVKKGVKVNSIFAEFAIVPKGRKELLEKLGFKKFVEKSLVERKMKKDVKALVVLNEKEACVMFPRLTGDSDISSLFYSSEPFFHEWCLDYFRYCWYGSDIFQESKLKEE